MDPIEHLEKLMMTDITGRYSLMYQIGLPHDQVKHLDLSGDPHEVTTKLVQTIKRWSASLVVEVLAKALSIPLPPGIPE